MQTTKLILLPGNFIHYVCEFNLTAPNPIQNTVKSYPEQTVVMISQPILRESWQPCMHFCLSRRWLAVQAMQGGKVGYSEQPRFPLFSNFQFFIIHVIVLTSSEHYKNVCYEH